MQFKCISKSVFDLLPALHFPHHHYSTFLYNVQEVTIFSDNDVIKEETTSIALNTNFY